MSDGPSELRRVLSASGVYAAAALAQRALAFLLLPVYTRYIEPAEYGKLELLTVFTTLIFGLLLLGLPSAIVKCYHRDCETPEQKLRLLATAGVLVAPVLIIGGILLFLAAPTIGSVLFGSVNSVHLVRLAVATGVLTSVISLVLSTLRAQERALAFSVLTLTQFVVALVLNIVFVVTLGMGVAGVLWGNLISNGLTIPLALLVARRTTALGVDIALYRPLVRFGLLIIPVMLSGWVINLSDRYVLRLFTDLADVAVYGVGYKFGMLVELLVVWPFQLAWPAFSFSISNQPGHRETYARALTYLSALLAYLVVGLTLLSRLIVPIVVGQGYGLAYRVVPWVALAYAFNGIQYCVSPGVHIADKTRYLTIISVVAAAMNLGLNLLLIPRWGMMAAAWTTTASFLAIALLTGLMSRKYYSVQYEYGRLAKVTGVAGLVLWLGFQLPTQITAWSVAVHVVLAFAAVPAGLGLTGFTSSSELVWLRERLRGSVRLPWRH